ncbi:MAG: SprB repeat-containing protein, partial [Actinobacteria bacterium]|nr:SprB repeat-containing protein [Actinomycetota bacterium]
PYTYEWSDGQANANATGLSAGTYNVTVTDANGCTASCEATVTEPEPLEAECSGEDGLCGELGSASVSISGGTSPYSYNWSNGGTTASIFELEAGTYSETVTDANGCTAECSTTITSSENPEVEIVCEADLLLLETNNGIADNTLNCNNGLYAFWSNNLLNNYTSEKHWTVTDGLFTENEDGTAELIGTYTNKDDNTLIFEAAFTFSGRTYDAPAGSPKENAVCVGDIDNSDWYYYTETEGTLIGQGALEGAVVTIGRFGEAFQVGTGANLNQEFEYGASGWLSFDIVSQPNEGAGLNGNSGHLDINFSLPEGPNTFEIPLCTELCNGDSRTLVALASAGDGEYEYLWSTGETTQTITVSPGATTTYSVTVTSDGCPVESSIELIVEPCFDCEDEQANVGDACNDNDPTTMDDEFNENCECIGVPTECTGIGDEDMDGVCTDIDCDDNDPNNTFADVDGDGFCSDVDCDDNDSSVFPGAP